MTAYLLSWCSLNLICDMTTFRKLWFYLLAPPQGRGCVSVGKIFATMLLHAPLALINIYEQDKFMLI